MTGIRHIVAVVVMFLLMTVGLGGSTEQPCKNAAAIAWLQSRAVQSETARPAASNVR